MRIASNVKIFEHFAGHILDLHHSRVSPIATDYLESGRKLIVKIINEITLLCFCLHLCACKGCYTSTAVQWGPQSSVFAAMLCQNEMVATLTTFTHGNYLSQSLTAQTSISMLMRSLRACLSLRVIDTSTQIRTCSYHRSQQWWRSCWQNYGGRFSVSRCARPGQINVKMCVHSTLVLYSATEPNDAPIRIFMIYRLFRLFLCLYDLTYGRLSCVTFLHTPPANKLRAPML